MSFQIERGTSECGPMVLLPGWVTEQWGLAGNMSHAATSRNLFMKMKRGQSTLLAFDLIIEYCTPFFERHSTGNIISYF